LPCEQPRDGGLRIHGYTRISETETVLIRALSQDSYDPLLGPDLAREQAQYAGFAAAGTSEDGNPFSRKGAEGYAGNAAIPVDPCAGLRDLHRGARAHRLIWQNAECDSGWIF